MMDCERIVKEMMEYAINSMTLKEQQKKFSKKKK